MIITCPECASEFDIPFAMIGPGGRTVRCANCRHEWHAEPPKPVEEVENPYKKIDTPVSPTGFEIEFDIYKNRHDAPEFRPPPSFSAQKPGQKKGGPVKLGGHQVKQIAVALLVWAVVTSLFGTLAPVLSPMSPALAQIYRGFGIDVKMPGAGLGLDRLQLKTVWEGSDNKVQVTTRILNLTETAQKVPPVQIEAMGEDGLPIGKFWQFDAPTKTLGPQDAVPFTVTLPDLPKDAGEMLTLRARFAS